MSKFVFALSLVSALLVVVFMLATCGVVLGVMNHLSLACTLGFAVLFVAITFGLMRLADVLEVMHEEELARCKARRTYAVRRYRSTLLVRV